MNAACVRNSIVLNLPRLCRVVSVEPSKAHISAVVVVIEELQGHKSVISLVLYKNDLLPLAPSTNY